MLANDRRPCRNGRKVGCGFWLTSISSGESSKGFAVLRTEKSCVTFYFAIIQLLPAFSMEHKSWGVQQMSPESEADIT
jgi:hypothetical protein